ncbi:MAG: FHA domain-containing protein [Pyrinomonadaceae bacterium]|nr:FHA domain-containing protein [Pyrinomonadaceae bacterium]MBP6214263.1 FHA domain-containing protein [Pyrinomonadaceae bacterium]
MTVNDKVTKPNNSPDHLLRGVLTKVGDTFDRFTGRRWKPSSSLAASELIERLKRLLDAEAQNIPGKGLVVPHIIQLKMQWDKFSTDSENSIKTLENELLTATIDHINDNLYYTYAPISLVVKPDYFTDGVELLVGFEQFDDNEREVVMNVTLPSINFGRSSHESLPAVPNVTCIARYEVNGVPKQTPLTASVNGRISVGRTSENSLVIDDRSVSKIHASLLVGADGKLSISDIGSTNGTFINDERIAYGTVTELDPADRVKFGTVEVQIECTLLPTVVEADDVSTATSAETFEIDGFQFSSKASSEILEQPEHRGVASESDDLLSDPEGTPDKEA